LFLSVIALAVALSQREQFDNYLQQFGKSYTGAEYETRVKNFQASLIRIRQNQRKSPMTTFGLTRFSDMSVAEFKSVYLMNATKVVGDNLAVSCLANGVSAERDPSMRALPTSWDWRTQKKVTPVKDQGECGSCWAFSTIGSLESAYAIKNKVPATQQFSEQMIVDCSHGCCEELGQTVCNQGCDGGWMWNAMTDIISWGGVMTETSYPYTGEDGTCSMKAPYMAKLKNYTCLSVPNGADETTLMPQYLVSAGPLSIALNADLMMDYVNGIINPGSDDDCDPTSLDHAVLIVGYGVDSATKTAFWIVKNSWNQSWGENGYFRIVKGSGACGLNNAVVSPILA
jgi:cathepsin F